MTKQSEPAGFTSLRILGKHAQQLLTKAKTMREQKKKRHGKAPKLQSIEKSPQIRIQFSLRSVIQSTCVIIAIATGTWIIFMIHDKLILILLAFFLAAIIDPGVRWMESHRVPRGLAILLHYLLALLFLIFLLTSLIPIIAAQLQQIALFMSLEVDAFLNHPQITFPFLSDTINLRLTNFAQGMLQDISVYEFADALQRLGQNLSITAQGSVLFATRIAGSVVNFFIRMIVVLILAFFIQSEKENIRLWIRGFFPHNYRAYIDEKIEAIHGKIGQWVRGQLLLGLSIGLLVFLALTILGMPYALTLSVLAGFTEFIPYVGPFIAAIPAVLIALTQEGLLWAVVLIGVYYVIQWCENNLLVPLIMKRAVGLSPIAIIASMLFGVSFPDFIPPILGLFLAVPATTIITLFIEDWHILRGKPPA
ncbi:hypothetical protein A3E47_02770 [Candidatus Peribacteria bacterium RIFCSPHIGHO2_12_FULL_54_10]|nr:MAG: hypothetical protein A3E47_02770 [Candidatus Peribacteria bacterium RIFCSPHIGHO2_12_FULL_54_10]